MGIWAILIYWYFTKTVRSTALIATLLWSYSAATSVWNFLAQKDAQVGNSAATMSALFNQIGCISLLIYAYNHHRHMELHEMAIWFGIPMAVSLVLQTLFVAQAPSRSY
jgi:prolipoprotein diacylglyceryltransferase